MIPGVTAFINHPANAHTDTDSYIYFPGADVIATGDIVSLWQRYITIDYANGGSLDGVIATVETFIKMDTGQTKYVPGHGPLATKADLQTYHDMLVDIRGRIAALIKAKKSEDDAVAAKPLADIGAKLHTSQMADDNMVKMTYRSLKSAKVNKA